MRRIWVSRSVSEPATGSSNERHSVRARSRCLPEDAEQLPFSGRQSPGRPIEEEEPRLARRSRKVDTDAVRGAKWLENRLVDGRRLERVPTDEIRDRDRLRRASVANRMRGVLPRESTNRIPEPVGSLPADDLVATETVPLRCLAVADRLRADQLPEQRERLESKRFRPTRIEKGSHDLQSPAEFAVAVEDHTQRIRRSSYCDAAPDRQGSRYGSSNVRTAKVGEISGSRLPRPAAHVCAHPGAACDSNTELHTGDDVCRSLVAAVPRIRPSGLDQHQRLLPDRSSAMCTNPTSRSRPRPGRDQGARHVPAASDTQGRLHHIEKRPDRRRTNIGRQRSSSELESVLSRRNGSLHRRIRDGLRRDHRRDERHATQPSAPRLAPPGGPAAVCRSHTERSGWSPFPRASVSSGSSLETRGSNGVRSYPLDEQPV